MVPVPSPPARAQATPALRGSVLQGKWVPLAGMTIARTPLASLDDENNKVCWPRRLTAALRPSVVLIVAPVPGTAKTHVCATNAGSSVGVAVGGGLPVT